MRRMGIRLAKIKNALRLIVISEHLFPQKAIKGRTGKWNRNTLYVIIQCRKEVLKSSWMLADLGEIRFTRMLILLPVE